MWRYLRLIFLCGPRIIWSYFIWMRKYAKHPNKYPLLKRYNRLRNLICFVLKKMHIEEIIDGQENLDFKTNSVIISNHLSNIDPLVLIAISEKPITFVAKKESEKYAFVGKCIKMLEGVFLDRSDLRQQLRVVQKVREDLKTKDYTWVIFAEGTRNKNPLLPLLDFHNGTFKIPTSIGVPIIPLSLYGTFRVLKKKPTYKKYPIQIRILPLISKDKYKDQQSNETASLCHQIISENVNILRKKDLSLMKNISKKPFNEIEDANHTL